MSARIVSDKDYVACWLDTSIHDFLEVLSPGDSSIKYALITCLDSNRNPVSLEQQRHRQPEPRQKRPSINLVRSRSNPYLRRGIEESRELVYAA